MSISSIKLEVWWGADEGILVMMDTKEKQNHQDNSLKFLHTFLLCQIASKLSPNYLLQNRKYL